ncbi:hypothetical protein D3C72_1191810 [compost metagenome]
MGQDGDAAGVDVGLARQDQLDAAHLGVAVVGIVQPAVQADHVAGHVDVVTDLGAVQFLLQQAGGTGSGQVADQAVEGVEVGAAEEDAGQGRRAAAGLGGDHVVSRCDGKGKKGSGG